MKKLITILTILVLLSACTKTVIEPDEPNKGGKTQDTTNIN